jgi:ribosomal protein S15P/S13E
MTRRFKVRSSLIALVLMLLVGGCANLAEIKAFATLSSDAAAYSKLTEAYIAAPEQMRRYTLPEDEVQRQEYERIGREREEQRSKLLAYHRLLEEYMKSLGALAADEAVNFDDEVGSLVDAGIQAKYVSGEQADAVKTIVGLLGNAAATGYRSRELKLVIERGNAPLQTVLADMRSIVELGYMESLRQEESAFNSYYRYLERAAEQDMKEPVAAQLVRNIREEKAALFPVRKLGPPAFARTLSQIGEAHQHLFEHRRDLNNKETLATLTTYVRKISSSLRKAKAAGLI